MRVLAATFADRDRARGLLDELQDRYDLGPEDAAVAPLGTVGQQRHGLTLLAGRFHDERVMEIRGLIERWGGHVVADVDKQWTDPWSPHMATVGGEERPV